MALLVIEFALIISFWRSKPLRSRLLTATGIILPGLFLVLALHLHVMGADVLIISASLAVAGLLHALDLWNRLQS